MLFEIPQREASFEYRGFEGGKPEVRRHLERVGTSFLEGYQFALESRNNEELAERLETFDAEFRGFASEGAAVCLSLFDALTPWKRDRFSRFADGYGSAYIYMVQVGAGVAMARLPFSPEGTLRRLDPVLCWLAMDGYGFHQGFFRSDEAFVKQQVPRRVRGYGRRAFDQGLGRSLWFVKVAEPDRVAEVISSFPEFRRGDMWSGVGLASCYAGGVDRATIEELKDLAKGYETELAQGAAFAAKARYRGGLIPPYTEFACEVMTGRTTEGAAEITDIAGEGLVPDTEEPLFEVWRQRIQNLLSKEVMEPCTQGIPG